MDVNCEMAREYAKDMVWENSLDVLKDQIYLFGHQYHRLHVLNGKVRVVLCDSPLIMGLVYAKDTLPISEYNPIHCTPPSVYVTFKLVELRKNSGRIGKDSGSVCLSHLSFSSNFFVDRYHDGEEEESVRTEGDWI